VQVARGEAEVPKRDAQLAKADIEKLRAETANLNSALERLQTEKTAAESKARLMVCCLWRHFDCTSRSYLSNPVGKSEEGNSSQAAMG
jgi:hypothetical protein